MNEEDILRAAALIAVLVSLPAAATEEERQLLRGIERYCVVVQLADDAKSAGLSEDSFRAKVELPLRQAGLDLVTLRAGVKCALVSLAIDLMPNGRNKDGQASSYVYTIRFDVSSSARLMHNPLFVLATLFDRAGFGVLGSSVLESSLERTLNNYLTEFANEALAAQPVRLKPAPAVKAPR